MMRFRWTRKAYRQANQLARLFSRFMELPDHAPAIVRRYWELWERYPQSEDPLLTPVRHRLQRYDPEIPF